MQIWFIGRTPASQAGKAGSIPVICFFNAVNLHVSSSDRSCSAVKCRFDQLCSAVECRFDQLCSAVQIIFTVHV